MKHIPFSGVVPVECLYWEQRRLRTGDKGRRRAQAVGEQSRITIATGSLGPGPPSAGDGHGWGWDRTNSAPSLAGILGFPAVKSPVAAGDRSLFLSTPAQLDASAGFVVPLTIPG